MLYLIDASMLITANNSYYPVDTVPEFWEWLLHQAQSGNVKMPLEIYELVKEFNVFKVLLLIANAAVVVYLIWRLKHRRRKR